MHVQDFLIRAGMKLCSIKTECSPVLKWGFFGCLIFFFFFIEELIH